MPWPKRQHTIALKVADLISGMLTTARASFVSKERSDGCIVNMRWKFKFSACIKCALLIPFNSQRSAGVHDSGCLAAWIE